MAYRVCQSIDTNSFLQYKPCMPYRAFIILIALALLATACVMPISLPFQATPTLEPTQTPIPTATPTPTPTATPTPTPTATPLPAARIDLGENALFLGDFEQARRQFQDALVQAEDNDTRSAAAVGIGRTLFLQHNYPTTITQLTSVIQDYPDSSHLADAWYWQAEAYSIQQMYAESANAYAKYIELRPGIIDGTIQEWRGDALLAAGNGLAAADAYEAALQDPPPGDPVWIRIKQAQAYAAGFDYTQAVTHYLEIYQTSSDDFARAQVDFLLGQTYLLLGESEQAYARFQDAVINFPTSFDSYSSLVELVNAGIPVSDLNRGLVDYFAGQYGLAVDAFSRYIENQQPEDATAYYYRALSRREMREYGNAIADFDTIIANFQADRFWPRAFQEKAFTLWAYMDQHDFAAEALLAYLDIAPDAADSADMLYEAARIYERGGNLAKAAENWERLINSYPSAEKSYRGLFLAAISQYRLGNYADARTIFQRALVLAPEPNDQAAAYLWIGKTQQAEGNMDLARAAWEQAVQRDPTGYYSERAAELTIGREPFTSLNPFDLGYDLNAERPAAETWLRTTFSLPPDTNLADMASFANSPAFNKANEFHRLGLHAQARDQYEIVRSDNLSDPVQTFRLMNYLLERNYYRQAILSSRQILDLANLDDATTLGAPVYFNHIRFGVYFSDLVSAAAQNEELNPLFLLSVIRQESLFEPFARSSANARGLMQIVPATGQELASQLNWPPGYLEVDLNRAMVSIPFGARYLSRQRDYFGNSLYTALAAYNGGPGNTIIWNEMGQGDPDLLLEVIRADETRLYIRQIFEFFNIYRLIYEQKP